jgi:hypothetical protein
MAGTLLRAFCGTRGARISWLIVGIRSNVPRQAPCRALTVGRSHRRGVE